MSAKVWLAGMVTGSVLVLVVGARHDPAPAAAATVPPAETPWLTPTEAAEIIAPGGGLGPLFAGVILGGTPPLPEVQARIADYAKAHNVEIALEIANDELRAIRFEVKYSGCCGYEGADTLANRMNRPSSGGGCMGGDPTWIDDWGITLEDGLRIHASVRVNRVIVRWEPAVTFDELLTRADQLLGADRTDVRREAADRWTDLGEGRARLDAPYPLLGDNQWRQDLGIEMTVKGQRIAEVWFTVRDALDPHVDVAAVLRSHYGRPRTLDEEPGWMWRKGDRVVRAAFDVDFRATKVTLRSH